MLNLLRGMRTYIAPKYFYLFNYEDFFDYFQALHFDSENSLKLVSQQNKNKIFRHIPVLPSITSLRSLTPSSLCVFTHLPVFPVFPTGSQRISDSEISDYDCEDGVGVITGKYMFSLLV